MPARCANSSLARQTPYDCSVEHPVGFQLGQRDEVSNAMHLAVRIDDQNYWDRGK